MAGKDQRREPMRIVFATGAAIIAIAGNSAWADVLTFDCQFKTVASPEGLRETEETFRMVFRLDNISGDGFIEGNNGLTPVRPLIGPNGITFLEVLHSRAVLSTTIITSGDTVNLRNTTLGGSRPVTVLWDVPIVRFAFNAFPMRPRPDQSLDDRELSAGAAV